MVEHKKVHKAEHHVENHVEHHVEHVEHTSHTPQKNPKVSNAVLGVISIFAIFLITWFAYKDVYGNNQDILASDSGNTVGQASQVLSDSLSGTQSGDLQDAAICRIIVGQTTLYDETTFAASLQVGGSAYYSGNTIAVTDINPNGCVVDVSDDSEFLAIGQVQRVGTVYVTIKEVILP